MVVLEIDVTADDILNGVREDALACPVALAAMRATGCGHVMTDGDVLRIDESGGETMEGNLPDSVAEFVSRFDRGDPVLPFSFGVELEPIQE